MRTEAKSGNTGFRVEVGGGALVHKWLNLVDRASQLPIQIFNENGEPSLPVGEYDVHNTLIHKINCRAIYLPGGNYELSTLIVPREVSDSSIRSKSPLPDQQETSGLSQLLGGMLGGEFSGRVMSVENFMQGSGRQELPVQLDELVKTMKRRGNLPEYRIVHDVDQQEIKITPLSNTAEVSDLSEYAFTGRTKIPTMPPVYLLKSEKEKIPEDPEEFLNKYGFYGKLVEEIINSLYKAKRETSPKTVFNFEPPDDISSLIKQTEQKLSFAKKQLSAAGYVDDGDDADIEDKIVIEKPRVRFPDVGGQEKAKVELGDVVAGLANPDEFYSEGAEPPKGIMLYGPSGTGKTLLARATAGEANAAIFSVGLASILHSLWGKTERYIQRIFDKASEQAPAIIFFDEIDAIARQRNSLNQAYSSIVNVLLTNMDGMKERSQNVVVIGATNLLDLVDDALLRPGRFDMLIPVDLPDESGRSQIFEIHKQKALERSAKPEEEIFDPNFDMSQLVLSTKGFSGADIAEILRRGLVERVRSKRRGINPHPLTAQDLVEQIALYEKVRKDRANRTERSIGFSHAIKS